MEKNALLIIDIQNDYFPSGKMELEGAEAAAEKAAELLAHFRKIGRPVFHIQHESLKPGATFFLPGTRGQAIHDLVLPNPCETVVVKHAPNAFAGTGLEKVLREAGIEALVVIGMMTFMCVDATARAAKDLGFSCTVVHDATAARALEFKGTRVPESQVKAAFLAALSMVCDRVVSLSEVLRG